MFSWIGLFVIAVGVVMVFIDPTVKKLWPEEPKLVAEPKPIRDERVDKILSQVETLQATCNHELLLTALEQLSKKYEALDLVLKNQRQVKIPDRIQVSLVGPVELTTKIPLKVIHKAGVKKPKPPATFESVKKQLEGLSK